MLDALTALGGASAIAAGVAGYHAVKATLELHSLRRGTSDALRSVYQQVVEEPIPNELAALLEQLSAPVAGGGNRGAEAASGSDTNTQPPCGCGGSR